MSADRKIGLLRADLIPRRWGKLINLHRETELRVILDITHDSTGTVSQEYWFYQGILYDTETAEPAPEKAAEFAALIRGQNRSLRSSR